MGFRLILNEHGVAWGADGSGVSGGGWKSARLGNREAAKDKKGACNGE